MKILIVTPNYPKDLESKYAFVHARAKIYANEGHSVNVFVSSSSSSSWQFEGINVAAGGAAEFEGTVKEFGPEVAAFHAPHYLEVKNYLPALPVPFAVWFHGIEGLFHTNYFKPNWRKDLIRNSKDLLKFILLRKLVKQAGGVVFVSDWLKRQVEHNIHFEHSNTQVVPNPIDTGLFKFKQRSPGPKAVAVRNLGWKYGIDIAVKAFRVLPSYTLTVLGSGSRQQQDYLLALAADNVCLNLHSVNHGDMPAFLDDFSFFVAPSRVEAQGVAMCEASACGLPVVATNVGGIPEFVKDGFNGYLVPPENPSRLAQAIEKLLGDSSRFKTFSINARRMAEQNFAHNKVYAAEIAMLENLVS